MNVITLYNGFLVELCLKLSALTDRFILYNTSGQISALSHRFGSEPSWTEFLGAATVLSFGALRIGGPAGLTMLAEKLGPPGGARSRAAAPPGCGGSST